MTNTDTNTSVDLVPGLAADDPRAIFARAVATGGRVVAGVRPDQLGDPTPCDDMDVRHLLGHLVAVLGRVSYAGERRNPMEAPDVVDGVADDGWPAAWAAAAHRVQAAWTDAGRLDETITLPWATLPGSGLLAMYTSEITVHTWDLATATGQQPVWDDEVVRVALAAMREQLPAEGRMEGFAAFAANLPDPSAFRPPFAAAVTPPEGASLVEQLAAFTGREVPGR